MIKQIKFVSIPVRDQNRALDFYTDKLGFTIITDQPFDEKQRWIELRIPKAETRVVLFTPEGDENRVGSFMNMSYTCDDIHKTYDELKKRGVEFEGPPQKQPWGTYAMFKDSEGNRFVVSSDRKSRDEAMRCEASPTRILREMQESRHYCRDSRTNQIKAALFLARARVIDLHRLLFLAALIFVPFKGHMVVVDDLHYFADLLFHSRNRFELRSVSERFGRRIVIAL